MAARAKPKKKSTGSVDLSTGGGSGGGSGGASHRDSDAFIPLSATASTAVLSPFAVPVSGSGADDATSSPTPLPSSPTAARAKSSVGGAAPKAVAKKLPPTGGAKKKETGAGAGAAAGSSRKLSIAPIADDTLLDAALPRGEPRVIGDGPQIHESAAYSVQGRRDNMEDRHSVCRLPTPDSWFRAFLCASVHYIGLCFLFSTRLIHRALCTDHCRPDAQSVRERDGRRQAQLFRRV
jgi:hypothetical protein